MGHGLIGLNSSFNPSMVGGDGRFQDLENQHALFKSVVEAEGPFQLKLLI